MESNATNNPLPPRYAEWVGAWLAAPIGPESRATCASCAMCEGGGASVAPGMGTYSPVTKCCTYVPALANYLVGDILRDDTPEAAAGRATVEARIRARIAVTPLGLTRTKRYDFLYDNGRSAFGLAASMKCPHFLEGGLCGVWRHRESTCATWFCKHERGAVGQQFWRRLHDLLLLVEAALARHAILEIGLPERCLVRLFPTQREAAGERALSADDLDERVDVAGYALRWGDWIDREEAFYCAASEIVAALDAARVRAIGGAEFELRLTLTAAAHARATSTAIPARVLPRQVSVVGNTTQAVLVSSYSNADPLSVPKALFGELHRFDGRPTEEVLAAIEKDTGLKVAPGVVRKLVDFGVLVEDC